MKLGFMGEGGTELADPGQSVPAPSVGVGLVMPASERLMPERRFLRLLPLWSEVGVGLCE